MWNAHVFRLRSINGVAQYPAPVAAVGIHGFSAEVALQAGRDAREDDLVTNVKFRHSRSYLLDDPNALMAQNASIGNRRKITFKNVKIGATNRRGGNPHNGITRMLDGRARLVLPRDLAVTVIDQSFHGSFGLYIEIINRFQGHFSRGHKGFSSLVLHRLAWQWCWHSSEQDCSIRFQKSIGTGRDAFWRH